MLNTIINSMLKYVFTCINFMGNGKFRSMWINFLVFKCTGSYSKIIKTKISVKHTMKKK